MIVGQQLADYASQCPRALAVCIYDLELNCRKFSYEDFLGNVVRCERELTTHSQVGDPISLCSAEPLAVMEQFFAIARTERVACVVDPRMSAENTSRLLNEVGAAFVWETQDNKANAFLQSSTVPSDLVDFASHPGGDRAFYVGFTSGSTGMPKGYCRNHNSWLESFRVSKQYFKLSAGDVVAVPGPFSHSLHLYAAVQALEMGASVVAMKQFAPRSFLAAMREQNASVLYVTPTQLEMLCLENAQLPSLRKLLVTGARWQPHLLERVRHCFPNAITYDFYGASELSFVSAREITGKNVNNQSVGFALPGITVSVRERSGARVPYGVRGKIFVHSKQIMQGYVCGEDQTFQRYKSWASVGDYGYQNDEGEIFLAGRESRMLNIGGVNVYPEEIEVQLAKLVAHQPVAVLGMADRQRGEVPVAVLSQSCLEVCSLQQVASAMRQRLGSLRAPRRYGVYCGEWPLTRSGKTDYMYLEQWLSAKMEP
ncbi:AMP-binding protein [Polycladidibacter stylochi]|uniref:AMP-binding protein n=1 Tax=Polycladidibacter stylochi TaxID=1807766 RepID=UPI000834CB98|nr:AMP-binding protein [Pseudovibrio stylochi]